MKESTFGDSILNWILSYVKELDGLNEKFLTSKTDEVYWHPPSSGRVKIDFDASYDRLTARSASGLVAGDSVGEVLASTTILHNDVPSLFVAEAHAGLQAIKLGISVGIQLIEIEGDSRIVIKKCKSTYLNKSEIGAIISDIKERKTHFFEIYFQFVPRSANTIAHILACETLKKGEETNLVG